MSRLIDKHEQQAEEFRAKKEKEDETKKLEIKKATRKE